MKKEEVANKMIKDICIYDVSDSQDVIENGLLEIEIKKISVPDFLVFKNQYFKAKNLKNFAATCYINGEFFSESLEKLISKLEELK